MCRLKELQDGTYSLEDLMMMHELMDLKLAMAQKPKGKG